MRQRRHPVEEMRRVARAGVDGRNRLLEIRSRVTKGYAVTGANEGRHEIERARQLGRNRDDADVGTSRFDRREDVAAGELAFAAVVVRQPKARARLRAVVVGIDEIAFKVCWQDARTAVRTARPGATDLLEHRAQQATVVGQNAVTPYRGNREAIDAIASPPSSVSYPSMPWT